MDELFYMICNWFKISSIISTTNELIRNVKPVLFLHFFQGASCTSQTKTCTSPVGCRIYPASAMPGTSPLGFVMFLSNVGQGCIQLGPKTMKWDLLC